MPTAYQNTLAFDQHLFNSRSNMHVNLVYRNSLHPQKALFPTFFRTIKKFLGEKQRTRTNNLHHRKAGSVAIFLSQGWGFNIYKKCYNNFPNTVVVKLTMYLARPPNVIRFHSWVTSGPAPTVAVAAMNGGLWCSAGRAGSGVGQGRRRVVGQGRAGQGSTGQRPVDKCHI